MRRFIEGEDRSQVTLQPECLDDFIDEEPVRAVAVFVDELDLLKLSFEGAEPAETGRPPYLPAVAAQDLHLQSPQQHSVQPPARRKAADVCPGHHPCRQLRTSLAEFSRRS